MTVIIYDFFLQSKGIVIICYKHGIYESQKSLRLGNIRRLEKLGNIKKISKNP